MLPAQFETDEVLNQGLKIKPKKFERNDCQAWNSKGNQILPVFNLKSSPRSNL